MLSVKHIGRSGSGLLRVCVPLALGGLCLWLLHDRLAEADTGAIMAQLSGIAAHQWGLAILATLASFLAVAQYDVIAHGVLGTGCPPRRAARTGAAAVALGQAIGFGPLVASAVRWTLLPQMPKRAVLSVTLVVSLYFLGALAVLAVGLAPPMLTGATAASLLAVAVGITALVAALWHMPRLRLRGHPLPMPTLRIAAKVMLLTLCDLAAAAAALWVLLPVQTDIPFLTLAPAFALATAAGLLGGTPGGLGPFELTLLALLPVVDETTLVAALLGFRLVYYVLPAGMALGYLVFSRRTGWKVAKVVHAKVPRSPKRAESAIAAQSGAVDLRGRGARGPVVALRQSLMLFLGTTEGTFADILPALRRDARHRGLYACLYKIDARDAAVARRAGWRVAAFSVEAVVDAQRFTLNGPERRQLRRMLRKAEVAGVTARRLQHRDWRDLAAINADWIAQHGAERGLTMGRFCAHWLADKPIWGAFVGNELVAFASGLEHRAGLSLDLMRQGALAPPGTMHLIVATMIADARADGLREVNLAALPDPHLLDRIASNAVLRTALARIGVPLRDLRNEGLTRFKTCFAPSWRPLYFAAPSTFALLLCGADIHRSIRRPPPLPRDRLRPGQVAPTPANTPDAPRLLPQEAAPGSGRLGTA